MNISIRQEVAADADAIERLTIAAFLEAPHTDHNEQRIIRALREAGALRHSLVAERDGVMVGHLCFSSVTISDGSEGWFGLGPIAVLPEYQGQGIGAALMRAGLAALEAEGAAGCVVLGDPDFYARFGFVADASLVLPGVPAEYFMARRFHDEQARGEVRYHAAFDQG